MRVILRLQTNTIESEVALDGNYEISFGRSNKSDQKIPDEFMSNVHCKLVLTPPNLELIDLESKNGTYLNGIRVEHADVFIGDEIKAGTTKISLVPEKMDPNSVSALTFPGSNKDKVNRSLQLDFTGARSSNQSYGSHYPLEKKPTFSSQKELEARKKAQSKIRLSKQEIKLRNKARATLSSTLDLIILVFVISLPLIAINILFLYDPFALRNYRVGITGAAECICFFSFYYFNFYYSKFTVGEKMSGIQDLYDDQD
jgi:pSer/pThr/pTyr-binding forkhead associated (FHA) protein